MAPAAMLWPLLLVAAFFAVLGMQKAWAATFSQLLQQLARAIQALPSVSVLHRTIGFGGIAAAILRADRSVYHWFGSLLLHIQPTVAQFFRYFAQVFEKPAQEAAMLAADVLHTLTVLRADVIPRMIAAKVAWIPRHLAALAAKVQSLAARAPVHIVREIVKHAAKAALVATIPVVAIPWGRIRGLERELDALRKRVTKAGKRVVPAVIVAPLVFSLTKLGLGWLRCAKVKRAGKRVCGMDESVLDDLLVAVSVIYAATNLEQLYREVEPIVHDSTNAIFRFWNVTH